MVRQRAAATRASPLRLTLADLESYQIAPVDQFQCFSNIVEREVSWNHRVDNSTSDDYGLVQALSGSKMSCAGAD